MSYSSDEFDYEIRGVLYDVRDKIHKHLLSDPCSRPLLSKVDEAIFHSDDYRINLMDEEGELDKEEDET